MHLLHKQSSHPKKSYLQNYYAIPASQSLQRILEKKGFVTHETFCKANRYTALISKEEYSSGFLNSIVERYFNNSYLDLVSAFTKKENFSVEQLEELKKIIDDAM